MILIPQYSQSTISRVARIALSVGYISNAIKIIPDLPMVERLAAVKELNMMSHQIVEDLKSL